MSWRLISETAKQKWGMSMEKNFKVQQKTAIAQVKREPPRWQDNAAADTFQRC